MFAFGDKEWPGIGKLIEECAEVGEVCGKLMMTRGGTYHWNGYDLKERLVEEIADVMAAAKFVIDHCGLDRDEVEDRCRRKYQKFERWHTEGDPQPFRE